MFRWFINVQRALKEILTRILQIERKVEEMATKQDLQNAVQNLTDVIAAEKAEASTAMQVLMDSIAALQAKIDEMGTVDLQEEVDAVNAATEAVKNIITPN